MRRKYVSTEFDGRRISVIVHRSPSDKLAVESFTRLACLGPSLMPVKEREECLATAEGFQSRFVNSCLANSLSVKICICTVLRTL